MSNKIERIYIGGDAYMLEKSEELHGTFVNDLADFTAFDTEFDTTFASTWIGKINTALGYKSDSLVRGEQKEKTQLVKTAMEGCTGVYDDIIYFAKKAFKGDKNVLNNEFGQGKSYLKARRNQPYMVEFMIDLKTTASKYTSQLLAQGCQQSNIDAIDTALIALHDANLVQNATIHDRPNVSATRVQQLNDAYSPMAQVMEAAQRVYKTNPTKMAVYAYNPPITHRNTIVRRVKVKKGETGNFDLNNIMNTAVPPSLIELKAKDSDAAFYATDNIKGLPGNGPVLVVLKGKKKSKTPGELIALIGIGDAKPFLKVENAGNADGTYTVTFRF